MLLLCIHHFMVSAGYSTPLQTNIRSTESYPLASKSEESAAGTFFGSKVLNEETMSCETNWL